MKKYTNFIFEGEKLPVNFIETMQVIDGVECDVYEFEGDTSKDLGIIRISKNSNTPKQLVLKGDKTIEGYISGKGKLYVESKGIKNEYCVSQGEDLEVIINVGDKVQWLSDKDSELIAYEICFPSYEDGRFQNI